ncbi:MAG: lysylphosphatidylglycerol synthase transmembrane domain-containing protein [Bacteroidia bacterium]|nr:lysylphosphatidylglycerol synthase transmembrane domain-containing protein [Bacteroidia bacterium]
MNNKLTSLLTYLLGAALGGLLLWLAFRGTSFEALGRELATTRWDWLALTILIALASHYFRAVRWQLQLMATGYKPAVAHLFAAVMTGYLANQALPRAGEIARCSVLYRSDRVPVATGFGTVVSERVIDLIILAVMIFVGFVMEAETLGQFVSQRQASGSPSGPPWGLIIMGLGLAGAGVAWLLRARLLQWPLFQRLWQFGQDLLRSALAIRQVPRPGLYLLYTAAIWVAYIVMTWAALKSMPALDTLPVGTMYLAFILTTTGAIGFAMPSPGGLGPYHAAVIFTFVAMQLLPDAADCQRLGQAFAILSHTSQLIMFIIVGGLCYLYLFLQPARDSSLSATPQP